MDYLPIFVAVTSIAVVIQTGILIGLFVVTRKTATRMEALADQVVTQAMPTVALVQTTINDLKPKIESIADKTDVIAGHVVETTLVVRSQIERIDSTVTELVDRARLQVIRTDEMVGRALDKVEDTSESVQRTVRIPVRQFSGLMKGVSAGFEYLVTKKRREAQPDDLFI